MSETDDKQGADPLARLIRAAGRRTEPPEEHRDQVLAAARRAWLDKVSSRRRRRWLALAASLGLLVASALLVTGQFVESGPAADVILADGTIEWRAPGSESWQRLPGPGIALPVDLRLRTGAEGRAALNLADGGSLRLAENTEITIGTERFGLDVGKLYFDSAGRSSSAPITVETPMGTVRDTGTRFEVSAERDYLRVRVREGGIALLDAAASSDAVAIAGEEIELSGPEPLVRRPIAPDDPAWAWAEALASPPAAARPILVYFRWIARETGKRLTFEPESVEVAAELATFSGDPSGLSPLELLSQIAATSDFDYRLTEDGAILIGRN
jgi:ferric-dicitrate binding protein FerR (iron transport regulator)